MRAEISRHIVAHIISPVDLGVKRVGESDRVLEKAISGEHGRGRCSLANSGACVLSPVHSNLSERALVARPPKAVSIVVFRAKNGDDVVRVLVPSFSVCCARVVPRQHRRVVEKQLIVALWNLKGGYATGSI